MEGQGAEDVTSSSDGGGEEEQDRSSSSSRRSAVLWERCIRQSIIVDLSEDESFHLSDLERSFAVHVSSPQADSAGGAAAEAGNHFTEDGLSASEEDSSDCSSSSASSPSCERVVEGKTRSSVTHVSPQRHNTMMDDAPFSRAYEESGQNTSDEDHEDLPYDSEPRSPALNHGSSTEIRNLISEKVRTGHCSPDLPELTAAAEGVHNVARGCSPVEVSVVEPCMPTEEGPRSSPAEEAPKPDMTMQLLFRHFSQEDLLGAGRLIEAETMPEVSLLESVDETLHSRTLRGGCTTTAKSHRSASDSDPSCQRSKSATISNSENVVCEGNGYRASDESSTTSEASARLREVEGSFHSATSSVADSNASNGETERELSRTEQDNEDDDVGQKVNLVRTRSFSELKYGQGQVHYPLPDFSKVAPKVKIPKTPCSPSRPVAQSSPSIMHRTQSSPGILQVISRVLEDSIQPSENPYVFKEESRQTEASTPALVDHLQAEYDKLLTKYAEAENLIDQMRLGTMAPSDHLETDCGYLQDDQGDGGHVGLMSYPLPPATNLVEQAPPHQRHTEQLNAVVSPQPESQSPSDGERMTDELRDIISHFMQKVALIALLLLHMMSRACITNPEAHKVEEFKLCLSSMSISIAEQQMMLRGLMEAQDQLQRNYLGKKEEHRALEMQNYMGLSRNTGTFDPDRLVEGDIFRLGMHLEDIKEVIDRNMCEQLSPPPHSSTPSTPPSPNTEPTMIITPALTPTLQPEGSNTCFSTLGYEMEEEETREEEELEGIQSEQSSEVITTGSGQSSSQPRHVEDSIEGQEDISIGEENEDEDEEGGRSSISTERTFTDVDIASYLTPSKSPSTDGQWSPESISPQCNAALPRPESECDLGAAKASPPVPLSYSPDTLKVHSLSEPILSPASTSQRDLSPAETDSGFGSSYLSQPAPGPYQSQVLTDSVAAHSAGVSGGSDSEGSWSNLQTAIHPAPSSPEPVEHHRGSLPVPVRSLLATPSGSLPTASRPASTPKGQQRRASCLSAEHTTQLWVESSATEPWGTDLQHQPAHFHQHLKNSQSEPRLSVAMHSPQRDSDTLHTCSCNREAIVALQSEVARLKRDLEDGLVQLPHLTQRMDYLASKYRHDRRPKTKSKTHHRPGSSSLRKTSVSRSERDNSGSCASPLKMEDWISTDMEPPSKSKGTDSGGDSDTSAVLLQFRSSPAGSRRDSSIGLYSAFELPGKNKMLCDRGPEKHFSASGVNHSTLMTGKPHRNATTRTTAAGDVERVWTRGWVSGVAAAAPTSQKPLLQVNYGSSCSLPASYKVQCGPHHSHSHSHQRKRSTQSDTALLPSDVYFQRTPPPPPPASGPLKRSSRTSRSRGSKEEELNRTLDRAIEAARHMKRTTDHMAKSLSADLAKAQLCRKLRSTSPPGGRHHNTW